MVLNSYIAFGIGTDFYSYIERLDANYNIIGFCDNNSKYWNQYIMGDDRRCFSPSELSEHKDSVIVVMAGREKSIVAIEQQCKELGFSVVRVSELFSEKELIPVKSQWPQKIQSKRIHKFIELLMNGTTMCNFHCNYCYVWRTIGFKQGVVTSETPIDEFVHALSTKRLGGPCHINMCAHGETMLSEDIVELVRGLLEEGHYVSVITNGTVSKRIDEILKFPDFLLKRLFFKISFHYSELIKHKLLDVFWSNVLKIRDSQCSYSLEITPCDSIIDNIDDIKRMFEKYEEGRMPHITFTRDAEKEGLDLLSESSLDDYINTWKVFQSDLFNLKCEMYQKKIEENCYAGSWSYRVNVVNGNLQSCYKQALVGTIYDDVDSPLPVIPVCNRCEMSYCFNAHAFLAWGDSPDIVCKDYLAMRDRESDKGQHWVKEEYRAAMSQKLYDNNFEYLDRWSDYTKLYEYDRLPAFIIFNSPDYSNIGDHAIAVAEKKFLKNAFPDKCVIEISCSQYIKENLLIRGAIKKDDIIILSGGGYIGSLWLWLEDITKNIIDNYKENKIYIFPQTIYFDDTNIGKAEKKMLSECVNNHPMLSVLSRDEASYKLSKEMFGEHVKKYLYPDMVLYLNEPGKSVRNDVMVCIRDDKENAGTIEQDVIKILDELGENAKLFSTIYSENVFLDQREEIVNNFLQEVGKARLVITDRLHAVLFCVVTHTPCIAFDNKSKKISGAFRWLKGCEWIGLCNHEDKNGIKKAIFNMLSIKDNGGIIGNDDVWRRELDEKYGELEKILRG